MKKALLVTVLAVLGFSQILMAQRIDTITDVNKVFRNTLYLGDLGKSMLGGYAQIDYNQGFGDSLRQNGTMDVHRMILFIGHKFNNNLSFFSEIEVEHVKEMYIEQAFLEYSIGKNMNLRSGLILIPMGIVNEYHEPPTFNGVERPNIDKYIIPTTWREIGVGLAGRMPESSINYQLYVVNGPLGYKGGANFRGSDGLRKGRQKGVESVISANPNLSGKINYYGMKGMNIGVSGYYGKSQSSMYNGLNRNDAFLMAQADSTVVGIAMIGIDYRYVNKKFSSRGQFIYSSLGNTDAYNTFSGSDLGSSMMGYYGEVAYDLIGMIEKESTKNLYAFVRYEQFYTHLTTGTAIAVNDANNRTNITAGFHFRPSTRTSFKADYQWLGDNSGSVKHQMNLGVGVWF